MWMSLMTFGVKIGLRAQHLAVVGGLFWHRDPS